MGNELQVRAILMAGLQDPAARDAALTLVHELGRIGYATFRDLTARPPA
jgi:hypothetical protein